jgi:hypothetical protein
MINHQASKAIPAKIPALHFFLITGNNITVQNIWITLYIGAQRPISQIGLLFN